MEEIKMIKKLNTRKTGKTVLTVSLILLLLSFTLVGCSSGKTTSPPTDSGTKTDTSQGAIADNSSNSALDTDGDGIPNSVEKTYGTNPYTADTDGDGTNDKLDKQPLSTENLIAETSSTSLPIKIKDSRVEDNATDDHLEITLTNTGATTLDNFDIYYTITDNLDKTQESYYQKLASLSLNAGETKTIHFDNQVKEIGHYFGNMNGLYGTSKNGMVFDVQLHANGFKTMTFQVEKAKGTAEVSD